MNKPINEELFVVMERAIDEGLEKLRHVPAGSYIGNHFGWREKSSNFQSGLPSFCASSFSGGPTNYADAFGNGTRHGNVEYAIKYSDVPAVQAAAEFLKKNPRFKKFALEEFPETTPFFEEFQNFSAYSPFREMIDRYIHTSGSKEYSRDIFMPIYLQWEASIFCDQLDVDILIPILCVKFDFDRLNISDGVEIARMPDDLQLARMMVLGDWHGLHSTVAGAATHCFVLKPYNLKNESNLDRSRVCNDFSFFPEDRIERLFSVFRIVTDLPVGYAQALIRPVNWASNWHAHLPPVLGTTVRRYPSIFERHYWLKEIPTVKEAAASDMGTLLGKLDDLESDSLLLACRRVNDCYLRDREDDAIVDILVGMEALVTDDSHQEITHKLALRVAAIPLSGSDESPADVFNLVKKIYAFRSKIVHGKGREADKIRKEFSHEPEGPVGAAKRYLRMLIRCLAFNPEFLTASAIDCELLLGESSEQTPPS